VDSFKIKGGTALKGIVEAGGSKNCALPVLFATLLAQGQHKIARVPKLRDMDSTLHMLLYLGCVVDQHFSATSGSDWLVTRNALSTTEAPYDFVRKMRASVLCLGPILASEGQARVSMPGGCAIGARPIDLHLMAFEKLGAEIKLEAGYVETRVPKGSRLKGARIAFPIVSVGATENAVMAASLAQGTTVIENAAQEPEIRELCEALITMGAQISGHGTSTITVIGQSSLKPMNFEIPADRIESATYLIAGLITGGSITLNRAAPKDLGILLELLERAGAKIKISGATISLASTGEIKPVDVKTAPFPGFPTDCQAQWTALMTQCDGSASITETIFENRFMHVPELTRMGAQLRVEGSTVHVKGTPGALSGAPVMATDLRASASLVLAALVAKGETEIRRIYHLDRGYESMESKLRNLGAHVERVVDG
jgi:UDP-N-acetylglucosamine 1-carboxyvinyltransferase